MTKIISSEDFVVPVSVQQAIRVNYSYSKNVEVEVRKVDGMYDIYRADGYQFTVNESGLIV